MTYEQHSNRTEMIHHGAVATATYAYDNDLPPLIVLPPVLDRESYLGPSSLQESFPVSTSLQRSGVPIGAPNTICEYNSRS